MIQLFLAHSVFSVGKLCIIEQEPVGHHQEVPPQRLEVLRVVHQLAQKSLKRLILELLDLLAREGWIGWHHDEGQRLELVGEGLVESLELIESFPGDHENVILSRLIDVDLYDVLLSENKNR